MEVAMLRPKKRRIGRRPVLDLKTQTLIPSEYEECKAFWQYCQKVLRLGKKIHHIANEGIRDSWYTKSLINIGLTPGVLDYHYVPRNDKFIGLWIEMKRIDGREKKKDADQEEFIAMLNENGHYATYAYGCDHAIKIYTDYVNNRL
jgi:hypothetical protein